MAKKTTTTNIDGVLYNLHSTKASGTGEAIGFVPVLASNRIEDFVDVYPESLLISCLKAGIAINLQAKARRACSSEGITQPEFDKIAGELLTSDAQRYAGNFGLLKKDVADVWAERATDRSFDEDKIWTELANG